MSLFDQCLEAYAAERGEEATLAPLQVFNDPDVRTMRRRLGLLNAKRIEQSVQQFERRTLDPDGLEMRMECSIPLDQFMFHVVNDGEDYWDCESSIRDFKKFNPRFVHKEPVRSEFVGWRARAMQGTGITLTDKWGFAA